MDKTIYTVRNASQDRLKVDIRPWNDRLVLLPFQAVSLVVYFESEDIEIECVDESDSRTIWIPQNSTYYIRDHEQEVPRRQYAHFISHDAMVC